jgi:Cupredoxin-like domain
MIAALPFFFPAFASAQDTTPDSFRELESKYIFGSTVGSDIGAEGERERELESETNIAFQKRTGSYGALGREVELEYNPTDSTQIEVAAHGVYTWISGVEGLDDRHGTNFGGFSSVFRYLVMGRGPGAPAGLQIAVEPEWSRVDDAGKLTTAFGAETSIIADMPGFGWRSGSGHGAHDHQRSSVPTDRAEDPGLRVEKVVAGNSEITIKLRPLAPGRYRFYGDFNEATAQGAVIAE